MRLHRLEAKNFRLLRDFSINFVADVTAIIGANNAGKSNVLDALLIFRDGWKIAPNQIVAGRGGFARVVSGQQTGLVTELEVATTDPDMRLRIGLSSEGLISLSSSDRTGMFSAKWEGGHYSVVRPGVSSSQAGPEPQTITFSTFFLGADTVLLQNYMESIRHLDPFRHIDLTANISPQDTVHATGADLARVLHYHYNNDRDRFDAYEELVKRVVPDVRMIETPIVGGASTTVTLRFIDDASAYNLQQLSSGLKDLLVLLAAVHFSPTGSLLIIEEPENHLHPSAQKAMARVVLDVSHRDSKQVILTTHSDLIVNQFPPDNVVVLRREGSNTVAWRLPEVDIYALWQEMGIERSLLMQVLGRSKQVIMIVEGKGDYQLFEPVWSFRQLSDKVIVARALGGGWKEIIDHSAALVGALERFRFTSKVFVLLDGDNEREQKLAYLRSAGFTDATSHVWAEKETESYLVQPTALATISGKPRPEVDHVLTSTPGRGKERLEKILDQLGLRHTPYHVIVQNTLANAPGEVPAEVVSVVDRVAQLVR